MKVVVAQYFVDEEVSIDNDTKMVFSGAQTVRFEEELDPEVIWDSWSTITLAKDEVLLEDIKRCKVTMCSNGGNINITQQGTWPGIG